VKWDVLKPLGFKKFCFAKFWFGESRRRGSDGGTKHHRQLSINNFNVKLPRPVPLLYDSGTGLTKTGQKSLKNQTPRAGLTFSDGLL